MVANYFKYGPATNKYIDVLVIANCVALENEIFAGLKSSLRTKTEVIVL